MKPKNDRQREVVALNATLPAITEAQKKWAYEHCFKKEAYQSKKQAWCSMCGGKFPVDQSQLGTTLLGGIVKCPHCGKNLKLVASRKQKLEEKWYYTIVTTCRGYQVCRNFTVAKYLRAGEKPFFDIREVVQNWVSEDGHEEVIARIINPIGGSYDAWCYHKPLELRDNKCPDMYRPDKYRIGGAWIYPKRNLLPRVKRNGYTGFNRTGIPESEHVRLLLTDREAEWLEKTGQYSLLKWKYNRGYREFCMPYAHAIRVANRHKYQVKDASLWMDYLSLLSYFGYDTHNAHYVCPKNLKTAHDRLYKRKEHIEALKYAEQKRKEAEQYEAKYKMTKGPYLGVCFGNENLIINVLQSVAEFAEEGKAMHHCVYEANYFDRPEALILSAKTPAGKRLATIEYNLKTFKVVQCRGVCNKKPEQYDEILELFARNAHLIREASLSA